MSNAQNHPADEIADCVTVSYPAAAGDRIDSKLDTDSYRGYLRTTKAGTITVGDKRAEFVSGGCGSMTDVVLRVEAIEGGHRMGEETVLVFEPRSETDVEPV